MVAARSGCGYGYERVCDNCYDGAPDSGTHNTFLHAPTKAAVIAEWNERAAEALAALEVST